MRLFHRWLGVVMSVCLTTWTLFNPSISAMAFSGQDQVTKPVTKGATQPQEPKGPQYDPIHDSVPNKFSSMGILAQGGPNEPTPAGRVLADIATIKGMHSLDWSSGNSGVRDLAIQALRSQELVGSCTTQPSKDRFYVFHLTEWAKPEDSSPATAKPKVTTIGPAELVTSGWYVYTSDRKGRLIFAPLTGTSDQSVYGKTGALVIGIATFSADVQKDIVKPDDSLRAVEENDKKANKSADILAADHKKIIDSETEKANKFFEAFREKYATTVKQGTPQNESDLATLIQTVTQIPIGSGTVNLIEVTGKPEQLPVFFVVSAGCQAGTAKLPFTLTVTDSTTSDSVAAPAAPAAGSLTCKTDGNITPCASSHSFQSVDKEYWDVSVGITTPGVRETKFSFSNNAVMSSKTTHTDFYAMLDLYWAGKWHPKDYPVPHPFVGLPVTGQTFYRPAFGLSETITGWHDLQRKLSLPIGLNFFAGVVIMKTSSLAGTPTTSAEFSSDLKHPRVWKGVFGFEVPISSMASKLGKKSSTSAKGSGTPSGSSPAS
jgi:hypothetical protein